MLEWLNSHLLLIGFVLVLALLFVLKDEHIPLLSKIVSLEFAVFIPISIVILIYEGVQTGNWITFRNSGSSLILVYIIFLLLYILSSLFYRKFIRNKPDGYFHIPDPKSKYVLLLLLTAFFIPLGAVLAIYELKYLFFK